MPWLVSVVLFLHGSIITYDNSFSGTREKLFEMIYIIWEKIILKKSMLPYDVNGNCKYFESSLGKNLRR